MASYRMTQTEEVKEQWECDTRSVNGPLIDSDSQNLLSITLDVPLQFCCIDDEPDY